MHACMHACARVLACMHASMRACVHTCADISWSTKGEGKVYLRPDLSSAERPLLLWVHALAGAALGSAADRAFLRAGKPDASRAWDDLP